MQLKLKEARTERKNHFTSEQKLEGMQFSLSELELDDGSYTEHHLATQQKLDNALFSMIDLGVDSVIHK